METRYDLYGELALPEPGSLGPALGQEQLATEELWRRIGDLDFRIRRQLARRTMVYLVPQLAGYTCLQAAAFSRGPVWIAYAVINQCTSPVAVSPHSATAASLRSSQSPCPGTERCGARDGK